MYTHINKLIPKHSSYTLLYIFRLLLLLFCYTQINYECKVPQPVDIFVDPLPCSLSLYAIYLFRFLHSSFTLETLTHSLSVCLVHNVLWLVCCRYRRLLWSQWCVLMHVSNEMLLLLIQNGKKWKNFTSNLVLFRGYRQKKWLLLLLLLLLRWSVLMLAINSYTNTHRNRGIGNVMMADVLEIQNNEMHESVRKRILVLLLVLLS